MFNQLLYSLRKKHGELHEKKLKAERLASMKSEIQNLSPSPIAVIGTPTHGNIGDSAIVLAEMDFLHRCFNSTKQINEITAEAYQYFEPLVLQKVGVNSDTFICWHGGGNMGDMWFSEEEVRRKALTAFSNHSILMMPQTIHYSDTEKGKAEEMRSIPFYNKRHGLVLVAREKHSYEIMKTLYPDSRILLTPDIVLSSDIKLYDVKEETREGVLMCLRNDPEKVIADDQWLGVEQYLDEIGQKFRRTDMDSSKSTSISNRKKCVQEKMQEFCGVKLVITDRLHGMVFAAITGTPCIAFSNNNHKVKGTYDWISYLPYIKYAENIDEAIKWIPELLEMKDCKFDNTPLMPYFEQLKKVVIETCQ